MPLEPLNRKQINQNLAALILAGIILSFICDDIYIFIVTTALSICGLLIRPLGLKISWGWFNFGRVMGNITQPVILIITFYLILTPIALLSRLFSENSIQLKGGKLSYFQKEEKTFKKSDFEKTW
jgi:hypothetical protein